MPERCFHGDMDDVRVYPCAVGAVGVANLFAGREPPANDAAPSTGEVLEIPEGTKLALELNGEIQLAGNPVLAATNIATTSARGTLAMPAGGSLTLTGPGAFNADVTGANAFVKAGPERLVLSGSLRHTGGTEVKGGTLALQHAAVLPPCLAAYDFELGLGEDSARGGRTLTNQVGVARVYDAERGGWVASFPGTAAQRLEGTVSSPLLTGNADYTISCWARPAADCPGNGTLLSLGAQENFREIVFRYHDISAGSLVLSHWGTTLDFTQIGGPAAPQGAWHHYIAMKRGATFTVFCDGRQVWTTTNDGAALALAGAKPICLGRQVGRTDRQFKGLLDDVRIYACALDADQLAALNRRDEPSADVLAGVPAPVLHYAFERPGQPGFDSAAGAHHLTKAGGGTLRQIDSPLGGKALQFDKFSESYLMGADLHATLPQAGAPFTVSAWVMTANTESPNWVNEVKHEPTFVSWGDPARKTILYMIAYMYEKYPHGTSSLRQYVRRATPLDDIVEVQSSFNDWLYGLRAGEDVFRWHHYATVYDPEAGVRTYIDGEAIDGAASEPFVSDGAAAGCVFYLGAKSTAAGDGKTTGAYFHGALDEVKVFAAALDRQQVRAVMRADAGAIRVLPEGDAVTVDDGATLEVNGTQETLGALAGGGTLDLASGCVTLTNGASSFAGTLTGFGRLRLAADATLTLERRPTAFGGVFEMAGGEIALPGDASAPLAATFRAVVIDGARQVSYPGAVEIPDGTAIALTQTVKGPLVSAEGPVRICGGGTVTLPNPKARGAWVIVRGASVVDLGEGDLSARWTVLNLEGDCTPQFVVTPSGDFVCRALPRSTVLLLR